jgi:hypothetical protein
MGASGVRVWPAIAAAALLAGCAPTYPIAPKPAEAPTPFQPVVAPPEPAPHSPIPRPDAPARDQCGAADLQGLIGHPRREVPVPLDPNRQRVACRGCPITDDDDPGRLNFFFDADSGLIREIRCG